MRTPIYVLIAALLVGGCTHYHVTPAGTPSVDRIEAPAPEAVEPLELDVGRPSGTQLLLQTNRPAFVAIFEIIPNRGVTLIYPAAAHQQNMMVSGLTWVPLWWSPKRVAFNSDRYIYAVASEEPLQLTGETFQTGYFHRILGVSIFRAESPYTTMRAISRSVVPDVAAEQWAEDVHVVTPTYLTESYRSVRIHCPGGRTFEVPEDMAARVWCPTRTRVVIIDASRPRSRDYPVGRPVRPDSIFGRGGRWKPEPHRPRGPIGRVFDPAGRDRDDRDVGRGRNDRDDRNDKPEKEKVKGTRVTDLIKDVKKQEQEREKAERERQRQEAEEARRREAEERRAEREERKDERANDRDARKDERDERKDERKDERDVRKADREERKDERKDEPKQQGRPREEKREEQQQQPEEKEEKREEKREEKPEKREEKREEAKGRPSIRDAIKAVKEKDKKDKP
jgi:hypothetical protein